MNEDRKTYLRHIRKALSEASQRKFKDGSFHLIVDTFMLDRAQMKMLLSEAEAYAKESNTSITLKRGQMITLPNGETIQNLSRYHSEIVFTPNKV